MMCLDTTTTDNDNTDVQSPRLFVVHARILSELSPCTVCVVRAVYIERLTTNRQQWRARGLSFSLRLTLIHSFSLHISLSLVHSHLCTHTPSPFYTHCPILLYLLCAAKQLRKSSYNNKQRYIII